MGRKKAHKTAKSTDSAKQKPSYSQLPMEVQQLWIEYKATQQQGNGDSYRRNQLIEIYAPLIRYNAERIHRTLPQGIELDDLVSEGVFGLMDAIETFDLSRGVKFETYCVPRIRGAMLDSLRKQDWVPRLVRNQNSAYEQAKKELEAKATSPITSEQVRAKLTEVHGKELADKIMASQEAFQPGMISLNKKWYETDSYKDVRELDIIRDERAENPTKRLEDKDFMKSVTKGLNDNERLLILLYYYEEQTMKEIGQQLDLSESRVSQMHTSLMERLKNNSRLREYVGDRKVA